MAENEQNIIQHALKYLAECEYDKRPAVEEAVAAELGLAPSDWARTLGDLRAANLVCPDDLALTGDGREYALHVLRAHRLYETYLAQKTGVAETNWHAKAHIKEHELSPEDLETMARELNHPCFDPHGDPIPTARGEMPPKRGDALVKHPVGWQGRVIHVEDEPPALYAKISAASITPGTVMRIEAIEAGHVRIHAEGEDFEFSMDTAQQITVVPLEAEELFDEGVQRLSSLLEGEEASIIRLSPLCRGLERNRLLDLGMVPGSVVSVDLISPSGSPVAYRIRGASIALRTSQADRILIRKKAS